MRRWLPLLAWTLCAAATPGRVLAQDDSASEPAPTPSATQASPPAPKKSKGRRGGDRKETEGTTAPNRFETDSVIKSQYHLDGEPLEVDPD